MYLQSNNKLSITSMFMNRRVVYQHHHTDVFETHLKPQPHSPDGVNTSVLSPEDYYTID